LLPVFCVAFLSHAKIMKFCDFVTGMQEFYWYNMQKYTKSPYIQ
jgi:hypothetical protein